MVLVNSKSCMGGQEISPFCKVYLSISTFRFRALIFILFMASPFCQLWGPMAQANQTQSMCCCSSSDTMHQKFVRVNSQNWFITQLGVPISTTAVSRCTFDLVQFFSLDFSFVFPYATHSLAPTHTWWCLTPKQSWHGWYSSKYRTNKCASNFTEVQMFLKGEGGVNLDHKQFLYPAGNSTLCSFFCSHLTLYMCLTAQSWVNHADEA